jgi:hypothetical protein
MFTEIGTGPSLETPMGTIISTHLAVIERNGKAAVKESADRYLRAIGQ